MSLDIMGLVSSLNPSGPGLGGFILPGAGLWVLVLMLKEDHRVFFVCIPVAWPSDLRPGPAKESCEAKPRRQSLL